MIFTVVGMKMVVMAVLAKAPPLMVFTEVGMVIEVREEQQL